MNEIAFHATCSFCSNSDWIETHRNEKKVLFQCINCNQIILWGSEKIIDGQLEVPQILEKYERKEIYPSGPGNC